MNILAPLAVFDIFRAPDLTDPALTPEIELCDADGVYLLDADGNQLLVDA